MTLSHKSKLWLCESSDMECRQFVAIFDSKEKANEWMKNYHEDAFHTPSITEVELNREYPEDNNLEQMWEPI